MYCVLCPDRERVPYRPPVCHACRSWLAWLLVDIRDFAAWLAEPADLVPDDRIAPMIHPRAGVRENGQQVPRAVLRDDQGELVLRRRDPIAWLLPSGSAGNPASAAPVSGSRNPPAPISVDQVDVLLPARQGSRASFVRGLLGLDPEQAGHLPLATTLDTWVRDWAAYRHAGENLPPATVGDMCEWLHARVEWACDEHPRVDEFASELRTYRSVMGGLLSIVDVPDYKIGVACRQCGQRKLFQRYGGPRDGALWVECGGCQALLSPGEYAEWVAESAPKTAPDA